METRGGGVPGRLRLELLLCEGGGVDGADINLGGGEGGFCQQ